jgi:hypothetical protein
LHNDILHFVAFNLLGLWAWNAYLQPVPGIMLSLLKNGKIIITDDGFPHSFWQKQQCQ